MANYLPLILSCRRRSFRRFEGGLVPGRGLKAEDGSTVSISKSAMFSDSAYSEDLNKVIGRLTMDIAGNKANRKAANYNKRGGKKQKFNVSEIGVDDPSPPSKPSKKPPGVDVSDLSKWFEKEDYAKLPPEWR